MDQVFSVLHGVLRKRGLSEHVASAHAAHLSKQWIDRKLPALAELITIKKSKDGVVCIECGHSVALQECQAVTEELLKYLKQECPFGGIREIRVARS